MEDKIVSLSAFEAAGSDVKSVDCLWWSGLTAWPGMGGVIMLACWERGEPEPAGRLVAQLTDDLFPLPVEHTLEREEQEQRSGLICQK